MTAEAKTRRALVPFAVAALSLVASVGAIELAGRLVDFDFDRKAATLEATPIFYRRPSVALGNGLFRRPGPDRWEGLVVTPMLERMGISEDLIPPEAPIVASYDEHGFRNRRGPLGPEGREDWEIAIAGDSFTELGHLPFDSLFTSHLGQNLGVRVANLGVSHTGPFSQIAYLRKYAGAPSLRHAVLAFFEGNDLADLIFEARSMRATAARRVRGLSPEPPGWWQAQTTPQSSFLRALLDFARPRPRPLRVRHAIFDFGGTDAPLSLFTVPPVLEPGAVTTLFESALDEWAETAGALGAKPWLVFLPCKRRVLHGLVRFEADVPEAIRRWRPRGLIEQVSRRALERGIAFVDATPALVEVAEAGRLPYNRIWDSHPNRLGAEVIAAALTEAIAETTGRSQEIREFETTSGFPETP